MKRYRIVWRPKARNDLRAIYDWIAAKADSTTAFAYTSAIEVYVRELSVFPDRGSPRDDLAAGIRTRPLRRRTVIGYRVTDDEVEILGLVHAGQALDGLLDD